MGTSVDYLQTRKIAHMLALDLSDDVLRASAYLERIGQRFCVEFGHENAVVKAQEHWRGKRREQQRKRREHRW